MNVQVTQSLVTETLKDHSYNNFIYDFLKKEFVDKHIHLYQRHPLDESSTNPGIYAPGGEIMIPSQGWAEYNTFYEIHTVFSYRYQYQLNVVKDLIRHHIENGVLDYHAKYFVVPFDYGKKTIVVVFVRKE